MKLSKRLAIFTIILGIFFACFFLLSTKDVKAYWCGCSSSDGICGDGNRKFRVYKGYHCDEWRGNDCIKGGREVYEYCCNCADDPDDPPPPPPPPPPPCGCSAPSAPSVTAPPNGTTMLNPDALQVQWGFNGNWGSDSGNQPNCYNNSGNDHFVLYYTKISGPNDDLGIGAPPGTCSGNACHVSVSSGARSYILNNLHGNSTYQISVVASTGGCGSGSGAITVSTRARPRFTFLGAPPPVCAADNQRVTWSGISNAELGTELASLRSSQPNNPVLFRTRLDLKTNNISMLREIDIQISSDPTLATLNNNHFLRAKYQGGSFYVYRASTGDFAQVPGNRYEDDNVILQVGNGQSAFRQVSSPPNSVETDFYIGFKRAYTSGRLKVYLSARFREISPDVDFYALTDASVRVQQIAANGISWNVLTIQNGSNQGIWGVDMIPPTGTMGYTVDTRNPNIANLRMAVTDNEAYLRRVFNRQFKRYLETSQASITPWQPYIDIYGTPSTERNFSLDHARYWPGPGAGARFSDTFSELYGGIYEFRVLGEDAACNVGAISRAQNTSAAWLRVYGADIYSKNIIDMSIPPEPTGSLIRPNQIRGSYLTSFFGALGANRSQVDGKFSNKSWNKNPYKDMSVENPVDYLKNVVSAKGLSGRAFPVGANDLWTTITGISDRIVFVGSSLSPVNLSVPASAACPRPMVIFVSGDLRIDPPFTSTNAAACLFVVDRNVVINDPTRNINRSDMVNAAFVVGGRYNSSQNPAIVGQKFFLATAQLIINGQVITKEGLFNRNLGDAFNKLYPAEDYRYDPKYLLLINDLIGTTKKYVFECGAVDAPECNRVN